MNSYEIAKAHSCFVAKKDFTIVCGGESFHIKAGGFYSIHLDISHVERGIRVLNEWVTLVKPPDGKIREVLENQGGLSLSGLSEYNLYSGLIDSITRKFMARDGKSFSTYSEDLKPIHVEGFGIDDVFRIDYEKGEERWRRHDWSVRMLRGVVEGEILTGTFILEGIPGFEKEFTGTLQDIYNNIIQYAKWIVEPGTIKTGSFQNWRVVALMSGLGFTLTRTASSDTFTLKTFVEKVFEGWEPSKDGSRLTDWNDLGDPTSPHFERRYIEAFRFIPEGSEQITWPDRVTYRFQDVIVWETSPHTDGNLYRPIALGNWNDWKREVEEAKDPDQGLKRWLKQNAISL